MTKKLSNTATIKAQVNSMFFNMDATITEKLSYDPTTFIQGFLLVYPNTKYQSVDRRLRMAKEELQAQIRGISIDISEKYKSTDDSLDYVVDDYFRGIDISDSDKQYYYYQVLNILKEIKHVNAFEHDVLLAG